MRRFVGMLGVLGACAAEAPPPPPPPTVGAPAPVEPEVEEAPVNRPPRVSSVGYEPTAPTTLDAIRAVVRASDPEGAPLDIDHRWFVNDAAVPGVRGEVLPARQFKKGDVVRVTVEVKDGVDAVTVEGLPITVANRAPVFLSDPRAVKALDGFRVEAHDEDDDPLTWSVEGGPAGLTIDRAKGVLRYAGSVDEPGGAYRIRVVAADPDGGRATWELGVEISPGSAAAKGGKAGKAGKAGG
jgi:hypothetical protein